MFTGLVEEVGTVRHVRRRGEYLRLQVNCSTVLAGLRTGDSVSIDGACQTAVAVDPAGFAVDTLAETLRKTTFGSLVPGATVNLERALRVGDRLGGHIVQGHVDGVGILASIERSNRNIYLSVDLDPALLRYCVSEGSIAISGISLTIATLTERGVKVNIIPETWKRTSLRDRRVGDPVNIEVDILARYVERLLPSQNQTKSSLDVTTLARWEYGGEQ